MLARTWILFFVLFASPASFAYPEFIGYGYKACLTCHYSGTGGGQLNDYGRALFAAEIAAKPFWIKNADDEKLANWSGFLGKVKTPYWLKPGIKYRRLYYEVNPGSPKKTSKYYNMQMDLNLASFTSEDDKLGVVTTLSYLDHNPLMAAPNRALGDSQIFAREYYIRWQQHDGLYWYFGFFDKAYGIKQPDHTAFSRTPIGVGENDQVDGVMMQWQHGKHELFVQPYLGNLLLPGDQQFRGLTMLYEYEKMERLIYGTSFKHEQSKNETRTDLGGHIRMGVGIGSALLFELGLKQDKVKGAEQMTGFYENLEFNYRVVRGVNLQSIVQAEKDDFSGNVPENFQWGLGLLYFPFQRVEWRMQIMQTRSRAENKVEDDQWVAQAQLHLSL